MVYSHQLQATHCCETPSWTGRWFTRSLMIQWGDVGTWVGGIGTVAAFILAIALFVHTSEQSAGGSERRRPTPAALSRPRLLWVPRLPVSGVFDLPPVHA